MFSDDLKKGTLRIHAGLEKKLVNEIRKVQSVKDYVRLLEMMYGYYQPLQDKVEPHLTPELSAAHGRQSENILNDIRHFDPGHDLAIPLCDDLPDIDSHASSLGAMYVTEGSTLGGQIITKMITRQLNVSAAGGFSFFNAYGDSTEAMWENFKSLLNKPRTEEEKQQMLSSATLTFEKFKDWITRNEPGVNN